MNWWWVARAPLTNAKNASAPTPRRFPFRLVDVKKPAQWRAWWGGVWPGLEPVESFGHQSGKADSYRDDGAEQDAEVGGANAGDVFPDLAQVAL